MLKRCLAQGFHGSGSPVFWFGGIFGLQIEIWNSDLRNPGNCQAPMGIIRDRLASASHLPDKGWLSGARLYIKIQHFAPPPFSAGGVGIGSDSEGSISRILGADFSPTQGSGDSKGLWLDPDYSVLFGKWQLPSFFLSLPMPSIPDMDFPSANGLWSVSLKCNPHF
jgi:hypothetical protein